MTNLRHQFAPARDDITTIGLREIVWDIHSGQEAALALRKRSQALGPPVGIVALYQPAAHLSYQNVLPTHTILKIVQIVRSILGSRQFPNLLIRVDDLVFNFLEMGSVFLSFYVIWRSMIG